MKRRFVRITFQECEESDGLLSYAERGAEHEIRVGNGWLRIGDVNAPELAYDIFHGELWRLEG